MAGDKIEYYIEARLKIPRAYADAVCNYIIDNITGGIVLEEEEGSQFTELGFYVPQDMKDNYRTGLENYLKDVLGEEYGKLPPLSEQTIKNIEWIDAYKQSIKPVFIGEDIVVRPGWHELEKPVKYDIIIEPRMAFGTGTHETTKGCLRAIRKNFRPGMNFLDLGTGSGILAILADKMGASYIKAIDYDMTAIENCRENFEINKVATKNEILHGSIEKCEVDRPYDFVCVNIIKETILPIMTRLIKLTGSGGFLILSGLLLEDEVPITEALTKNGQTDFSIDRENNWITYTVKIT